MARFTLIALIAAFIMLVQATDLSQHYAKRDSEQELAFQLANRVAKRAYNRASASQTFLGTHRSSSAAAYPTSSGRIGSSASYTRSRTRGTSRLASTSTTTTPSTTSTTITRTTTTTAAFPTPTLAGIDIEQECAGTTGCGQICDVSGLFLPCPRDDLFCRQGDGNSLYGFCFPVNDPEE